MFDFIGSGAPSNVSGADPATYFDKSAGIIYYRSTLGWQPVLYSAADALTAHASGGQASATQVTTALARFTTVATIADSAKLPVSVVGLSITITNAATNSMNVFPVTGDAINALGANAAFALAGGKTAEFVCMKTGQWHAILSA